MRPQPNTPLDGHAMLRKLADAYPSFARFFRWWQAELCDMVPLRIRQGLTNARPVLHVEEADGMVALSLLRQGNRRQLDRIDLTGLTAADTRLRVDHLLSPLTLADVDLATSLPREQALCWSLEMPSSVQADLMQAIRFQISRRTPFDLEDVLYDYRTRAVDGAGSRLTVDVAVAPRGTVEETVARLSHLGLKPDVVDVASDDQTPYFNLLSGSKPEQRHRTAATLNPILGALAIGLLATAVALPFAQRREHLRDLQARLADVEPAVTESRRLRAAIEQATMQRQFLVDRKAAQPTGARVLEELSRLLPDHTALTELRVSGTEAGIAGSSADASALIGLIDGSDLFREPRFRAPVTRDQGNGRERFNLSFRVEAGAIQ